MNSAIFGVNAYGVARDNRIRNADGTCVEYVTGWLVNCYTIRQCGTDYCRM